MTHVRRLAAVSDGPLEELAKLLIDCVDGGESVSFMHPLPMTDALAFWTEVARRRGLGAALMQAAEGARGRPESRSWCWTPRAPKQGGLCDTTYFYRILDRV